MEIQIEKVAIIDGYLHITALHHDSVMTAPATLEDPAEYGDAMFTTRIPLGHLDDYFNMDQMIWYEDK